MQMYKEVPGSKFILKKMTRSTCSVDLLDVFDDPEAAQLLANEDASSVLDWVDYIATTEDSVYIIEGEFAGEL